MPNESTSPSPHEQSFDPRSRPAATGREAPPPSAARNGRPSAWRIMDPVRRRIHVAMALATVSSALSLAALGFLATTLHALAQAPRTWPVGPMLGLLVCTVLAYVLRLKAFDRSHLAAFRLEALLRTTIAEKLAVLPLGVVQSQGAGQLAKVIYDDVHALHAFVADSTPLFARAYAAPLMTLLALLWLDWRMTLVALAVPVVGFVVLGVIMHGSKDMSARYNAARERVAAAIVEFVQAMPVVRTFDSGSTSFGRFQRALHDYRVILKGWWDAYSFSSRFSMAILSTLPTLAALLWAGAWWMNAGSLSFSTWVAVLLIGAGLAEAFFPLINLYHLVERAQLSIDRLQQVLALEPLPEVPAPGQQPQDAGVVFEHVGFRYTPDGEEVLHDVSFTVPAGSVTALVGPSGAGKSTVARLIPRFWDVEHGCVRVGGVDVREMTQDTLMRQVAFVFQDTFLFDDTLAENIRLGSPDATMDDVMAAAHAAQAHDFIMALPQGYETRAGERGIWLSGGQRQRITIARAILQDRPILVLDEATAFADPENEALLVQALARLMHGKTVILVAHRLSTIIDADQILVFDRGRLVEHGTHAELLQATEEGVYARLWNSYQAAQRWSLPTPAQTTQEDAP